MPSFDLEHSIHGAVCGLDEVGRGPLAGPVVAACVYIPKTCYDLDFVSEMKDSKKLSETKRTKLFQHIQDHFIWSIQEYSPAQIDEINILQASLAAMREALYDVNKQSERQMDHALVDGNHCPKDLPCASTPVIKGDNTSYSIAAASILAKVHRDELMKELAAQHPHYGWERNMGYPTKEHLEGINLHGITEYHRKSFAPVRNFIDYGSTERQESFSV